MQRSSNCGGIARTGANIIPTIEKHPENQLNRRYRQTGK